MIRFQNRPHARTPLVWDFIKEPSGGDMIPKSTRNQVPLSVLIRLSPSDHQMISPPIALANRVRRKAPLPVPLCLVNCLVMDCKIFCHCFQIFFDWIFERRDAMKHMTKTCRTLNPDVLLCRYLFLRLWCTSAQNWAADSLLTDLNLPSKTGCDGYKTLVQK